MTPAERLSAVESIDRTLTIPSEVLEARVAEIEARLREASR